MIVSLAAGIIPPVRVVLSAIELKAGQAWALTASYTSPLGETVTYRPRAGSGIGEGAQVLLVDLAAPMRTPVTYTLTREGELVATASVTRTSPYDDALVSLNGSTVGAFDRLAEGGDRREPDVRMHVTDVPGNPYPVLRLAPVASAGSVSLRAETDAAGTRAFRTLAADRLGRTQAPVYVFHSCDMPECDIPLVELGMVTAWDNDRLIAGAPQRVWSLSYLLASDPEPDFLQGVSTWVEFDARWAGYTWDDFDAAMAGKTWDDFDLIDWDTFA